MNKLEQKAQNIEEACCEVIHVMQKFRTLRHQAEKDELQEIRDISSRYGVQPQHIRKIVYDVLEEDLK
jgi:hypothetical protein